MGMILVRLSSISYFPNPGWDLKVARQKRRKKWTRHSEVDQKGDDALKGLVWFGHVLLTNSVLDVQKSLLLICTHAYCPLPLSPPPLFLNVKWVFWEINLLLYGKEHQWGKSKSVLKRKKKKTIITKHLKNPQVLDPSGIK